MSLTRAELNLRFDHHSPRDRDTIHAHEEVRALIKGVAARLGEFVPSGCREHSLVFTKLEEALFWANAAIARDTGE